MIERIVGRPVSTLIGALTLVVLGVFSLLLLPVSLLPALERPSLTVEAGAEGRSREEVLEQVTRPLERQLGSIRGVTSVRSLTGDGFSRLLVESEWQTDADQLRIEAERRLANVSGGDPSLALSVEMADGDASPVVEVAVLGGASGAERTAFAREVLVPELARIEGAGRLETAGFTPLHAVVRPRAAALAARGLTPADVVARLRPVGEVRPAGRARAGSTVRPLLVREEAASLDALRALRIPGPRGEALLGDVAGVALEEVEDESFFRLDGEEGVLVRVFRSPEANAVALARQMRERLAELTERTGGGLRLQIVADRSSEVVDALRELGIAAGLGLLLGVAVLRALLGSWRPTLALAVVAPASILAAFAAFQLFGVPLDLISLAGLALAAGMVVDSSIVVLESIASARAAGSARPEVAGTRLIAVPVLASFATTAVVFLPLIYLEGLARAFFGVQAFAIVAALAAALLFSLTVTPVLSRGDRRERRERSERSGRSPGRRLYLRLLDGALARPALAVAAAVAVTALAVVAAGLLPRELVPDGAARDLAVRYRLDPDLTPEAARRGGAAVDARVAAALAGLPAVRTATQLPEADRGFERGRGDQTGEILVSFPDPEAAGRALPLLRAALGRLPGVEAWIEQRTGAFVESIERAGRRVEIVVTAATPEEARALAGRVAENLRQAGLREAAATAGRGSQQPQPALLLTWDTARLAAAGGSGTTGADRDRLAEQIRDGLGEQTAGRVRIDEVEPEILVRGTTPGIGDPALLPVSTGVPLAALAMIEAEARPPLLEQQDGLPAVRLTFQSAGADPERILRSLPSSAAPAGQALEMRRAFGQLRLALGLSLLLVFLTVAALYESFATPLAVMATVPVAAGGALGLLLLTGQTLNILSFLGLILLAGLVVNNAIVLVHRIEQRVSSGGAGESIDGAIRGAAAERYRPILMTTVTTLAGMLPLALLGGEGAELRQPLALAVIGGLATSTFASLLLVPVLYRALLRRRSGRRSAAEGPALREAA